MPQFPHLQTRRDQHSAGREVPQQNLPAVHKSIWGKEVKTHNCSVEFALCSLQESSGEPNRAEQGAKEAVCPSRGAAAPWGWAWVQEHKPKQSPGKGTEEPSEGHRADRISIRLRKFPVLKIVGCWKGTRGTRCFMLAAIFFLPQAMGAARRVLGAPTRIWGCPQHGCCTLRF